MFLRSKTAKWPAEKNYFKTDEELKKNVIKEIFSNYVKTDWLPDLNKYSTLKELVEETAKLSRARQNLDDNLTIEDKEQHVGVRSLAR